MKHKILSTLSLKMEIILTFEIFASGEEISIWVFTLSDMKVITVTT